MLHAKRLDSKRKWLKDRETSRKFKHQRLQTKSWSASKEASSNVREGPTYKPAIDLEAQPTTATIATVPGPISLTGKEPVVFLDLETTGLGQDADICQLSAVCGNKSFDIYTMPIKPISSGASAVTGLTVKNNKMYHNGKEVDSVPV